MYHALLPQKTVRMLKNEYHIRFFVVFLFFVSLAVSIASIFLFPSYLISSLGEKSAAVEAESAKNGIATDTSFVTAGLSSAGALISAISSSVSPPLSPAILRVASLRPKGIKITSFDISSAGPLSAALTINGTAATRDDLVTFKNVLEGDSVFSNVEEPISDLASAENIQFSMQMSAALSSSQ